MTETAARLEEVPIIHADPFTVENLTEPHALHEQLREAGPVAYLDHYGIWAMARYEQVNAALKDWKTFSSAAGVGLSDFRKEKPFLVDIHGSLRRLLQDSRTERKYTRER